MNGASASFARRRAISVLPTPVGPIIRMFFGVISWRKGSATCWRRQRLRSATATAFFARPWPMICLSSSETISAGVMVVIAFPWVFRSLYRLDDAVVVRINAHVACDRQRFFDDIAGREFGVFGERLRRGLRIRTARSDRANAVFRVEHVAVAGDDERGLRVGGNQHGFQPTQHAVGAPVLRELDGGACQVALVLFQLGFEAVEQRERVGGAARKADQHLAAIDAPDLFGAPLHDDVAKGHLAVAAKGDLVAASHGDDRRAVKLFHMGSFESEKWRAAGCLAAVLPGIRWERDAGGALQAWRSTSRITPALQERVMRILGRRNVYQGAPRRFDAFLRMNRRRRLPKNKKAHDGSCALGDFGGAFPAAGSIRSARTAGLDQSPNSFWRNSRRSCASSDSVAVGRAIRRGMPIGSPVSSHQP